MAWEQRGNGRYYYRKDWENGHCVSVYLGAGETAVLIATCERYRQAEEAQAREAERSRRAEVAACDQTIAELEQLTRELMRAVLLMNGYHQHKGQWRRKRERRSNDP